MKKIIITFLLFCIFIGSAFAQVTFSGDAYIGIEVEKKDGVGEEFSPMHRDEGMPLFNFAAIVNRENYGAKLDTIFRYSGTNDASNDFILKGIYGWVNFFDKALTLSMGRISDAAWVANIDPRLTEYFFDEITGFRFEYKTPLEGLSVGAAFPFRAEDNTAEKLFQRIILGATYVSPLFTSVFSYDVGNNGRTLFGFNFIGIPAITAGVQLRAVDLVVWDNPLSNGQIELYEKIGYKLVNGFVTSDKRVMRGFEAFMIFGQRFYGRDEMDPFLSFAPGISYKSPATTNLAAAVPFLSDLTASLTFEINSSDVFETTNMIITPCFEYALKGPSVFYIQYELGIDDFSDTRKINHRFGFGIDIKAF